MKYEEATELLKRNGFKLKAFIDELGMVSNSYRRANKDGMRPMYILSLKGFLASRNEAYQSMVKHEDNEAMTAQVNAVVELGKELDKESKK